MVSTRPSPNPAKGRIAYPTVQPYAPGDDTEAPSYTSPTSEPIRPVTSGTDSDNERNQGIKTWWKGVRDKPESPGLSGPEGIEENPVFGVPLSESIKYASVQISTVGEDDKLYVWGVVPVVVARCGLYLKETATEVEGAFRISGSSKRMRELQQVFDTAPRYGKDVDWKALDFSPHDVATIFRRFLTQMPESIIPNDFYEDFRAVLSEEIAENEAVERYKDLVRSIPPINQYLLLYVLDLLSVFARKSDKNLMTAPNLALIFTTGVLSHPAHAMRPKEHVLSQHVLEFLIEHQDHFLIGMQLQRKSSSPSRAASPPAPEPPKEPEAPRPPTPIKADPDLFPPSDSDDDPAEGGYYIIEGNPRSPPPGSTSLVTEAPKDLSPSTANLIPRSPTRVKRAPITSNSPRAGAKAPAAPSIQEGIREEMAASDSDDDNNRGGYEVRISAAALDREARNAAAKGKGKSNGSGGLGRKLTGGSTRPRSLSQRLLGNKDA